MALNNRRIDVHWVLFWALFVVGAALRVAELWRPLSHDELSAICRLRFSSLAEMLEHGVRPDGHPAGVQVLLWLWTRVAGTSPVAVRLPFVLMGVGCLPLAYGAGRLWYGRRAGLWVMAAVALSQYGVYYAGLARPYGAGLFAMLVALYAWSRMHLRGQYTWPWLALFAVAEAACAYTQYFCALAALLLGVAGLLFARGWDLWRYLGACLAAVFLFLPHLGITLFQLTEMKGVGGWLGQPGAGWVVEYGRYLLHHSWLLAVGAVVALLAASHFRVGHRRAALMTTAAVLFALPLVAGYVYSVKVSPVLQFSTLIFSWPFLLLAVAGWVDEGCRPLRAYLPLACYALLMVGTLFATRRHFDVVHREWIGQAAAMTARAEERFGKGEVLCLVREKDDKLNYYNPSVRSSIGYSYPSAEWLDSLLQSDTTRAVVVAKLWPGEEELVGWYYPYVVEARQCVETEVVLRSRHPADGAPRPVRELCGGSMAGAYMGEEYFTLMDTTLASIADSRHVRLVAELLYHQADSAEGLHLVCEVLKDGRCVDWQGASTRGLAQRVDGLDRVALTVSLPYTIKHRRDLHRCQLKVYLWNPSSDGLTRPESFRIGLADENPYAFAVLEEI